MKPTRVLLLALAFSASPACSGPRSASESSSPRTASLVKKEDLPERERAVLDAWRKSGAAWEIERERVRNDPKLVAFLVDNLIFEMVRAYDRSRLTRPGQQTGPFERAQSELVVLAEASVPLLAQMLALPDGIEAFLAADTLRRIGTAAVPPVARELDEPRPEVRRRAAELLGDLPDLGPEEPPVAERLARVIEKDDAWIVRCQAALALGARGGRSTHPGFAMGVLLRALDDPDASVAERSAKALGTLGEPRAIPRIIDALEAQARLGRPAVVSALQASLGIVAHEPAARRDPDSWRNWWNAHGNELTGARARSANTATPPGH